ncbi:glycosyltransferase [Azorhizobium sp. AG788]|uniref:glycosyltransferase n=1 Tax=Azorhizobium sp. AG788 TaxID=2183897 RepID=UPI003138DFCC
MTSWIKRVARKLGRDAEIREAIERRAQLVLAEADAAAAQREDALRHAIERRAQLTTHEAAAFGEQRIRALWEDIERRAQLAVAEASARADLQHHDWRAALAHHVDEAISAAMSSLGQDVELLQDKVERGWGPAAGGASTGQVRRGGGDSTASARGPAFEAFWSPALTWSVEAGHGPSSGLGGAAAHDFAQALTELGHDVLPAGRAGGATVTALVSSDATSLGASPTDAALLVGFDWGESGYSLQDMARINATLSGVACASRHAEKVLIDHGIAIPTATVGVGLDGWERIETALNYQAPGKSFRFLHVSDCDAASGVDLLLESFGRVFASDDAVSLIVRPTGPVPAHLTATLKALRAKNRTYPDVIVLTDALTAGELKALYCRCQVFLAPSRAGGYGLPIAHALLSGLPVVATAWGGHMDYCDRDNAWLVDYEFQDAKTSHELIASVWAEALPKALDEALWLAFRAEPAERFAKAWSGRKHLIGQASWKDVALRAAKFAQTEGARPGSATRESRVGFVSTWNSKCGIATYMGHLLANISSKDYIVFAAQAKMGEKLRDDDKNCVRIWNESVGVNGLSAIDPYLESCSIDVIIIQFNYGFFNSRELKGWIESLLAKKIAVVIELHSTLDPPANILDIQLADYADVFRKCDRLLVHGLSDLNRLKALGLAENAALFPLGVLVQQRAVRSMRNVDATPLVTTFGFCLPDKGLLEFVHAVGQLKRDGRPVRGRMLNAEYPDPASKLEAQKVRDAIQALGLEDDIEFVSAFLDDAVCLRLLGEADLLINPYQKTGESASASTRYGLAAGCPVLVTPLEIFDDLGGAVFRTAGTAPEDLAAGMFQTLTDLAAATPEALEVNRAARHWAETHNIARQGECLIGIARAVVRTQRRGD